VAAPAPRPVHWALIGEVQGDSVSFLASWYALLQEVELARNYPVPYQLTSPFGAGRNVILEAILPSLLFMKATDLLDEALKLYMQERGLALLSSHRDTLAGRIAFLHDQGLLSDRAALLRLKDRRNELAHESVHKPSWAELDVATLQIHKELRHLGFAGDRPHYQFYAEKSPIRASAQEGADGERTLSFGLKKDGRVVLEVRQIEYIAKEGAGG
jgi:hypothetical protein